MAMLVDSHCHLEYADLASDIDGVLARARGAGVGTLLSIGTKLATFDRVLEIASRFDDVWCSVGVHPHEAAAERLDGPGALLARADHPKVVGLGETGLDYYYDHAPRDFQIANFRAHIAAARQHGLPLIVHTRDAEEDTIHILQEEMSAGRLDGVLHCFTGSIRLATAVLDLGFYISASGIVTFKNSEELRSVFREVPLNRLLVETDSPYLAPVPFRGKPNEPAYVSHTAAVLAAVKNVSADHLAQVTTENFFRLFAKARQPAPGGA